MSRDYKEYQNRYYLEYAIAYIRATQETGTSISVKEDLELFDTARARGKKVYRFKKNSILPRIKRAFGFLRAIQPNSLLDIGSGRGAFLWPLLENFPDLMVDAIDKLQGNVEIMQAVHDGGITRLTPHLMDVCKLSFEDNSFHTVTALEVLEHIPDKLQAAKEIIRVAQHYVVVSVPSKLDNNPEHIHFFTQDAMHELLLSAGAEKVSFDYVLNHMLVFVTVGGTGLSG